VLTVVPAAGLLCLLAAVRLATMFVAIAIVGFLLAARFGATATRHHVSQEDLESLEMSCNSKAYGEAVRLS
jgi:hypothetical protein